MAFRYFLTGEYWRQLPLEQKRVWEVKAKQEKAAHKAMFPDYRFRPVHSKHKRKAGTPESKSEMDDSSMPKDRQSSIADDDRRCEEVAQLLLEGKDGEDLAKAVRELDIARGRELGLSLGASQGLEPDEAYDYNVDSDSRSPSFDPEPTRGYNPDGNRRVPSTINNISNLHMPTSVHPPYGMDFSVQNTTETFFPPNNAMAFARRPSSVPLPLPNAEWFANPNPFMASAAASGGIAPSAVPPFTSEDHTQEYQNHQEFTNPNPFSWEPNQAFQQRMSFQFFPVPFPPHQLGQGITSAPAQVQHTLQQQQQQQLDNHAPIQPDAQGLFHPQPQMFGVQTSSRSSLERRASSAGPFFRRSWTMPIPFSTTFDPSYGLIPGFNIGMDAVHVEMDHSPLPDVDPSAAGLFADFSFEKTSGSAAAQLGGAGHNRTLSGTSQHAVDPTDSSAAVVAGGMMAPTNISISVPPLVHSQSQNSASTDRSWANPAAPQPNHGQYMTRNGVYAQQESVNPGIQVYAPDQMYSMPGPNGMDNGMYDVDHNLHFQHQLVEQGGLYGMRGNLSKPIMMGGTSGGQVTEANFGHGHGQQVDPGVYFEVA